MRKRRGPSWAALLTVLSAGCLSEAIALEGGFQLGGVIDLHNSFNAFMLQPYISVPLGRSEDGGPAFYLPLTFGFATDIPFGISASAILLSPSLEFDIPVLPRRFYLSPTMGISLGYLHVGSGADLNMFNLGIPVGLQAKYVLKEKVVFRFMPIGFLISPWRCGNNDIGSDSTVALNYMIFGGVGYRF